MRASAPTEDPTAMATTLEFLLLLFSEVIASEKEELVAGFGL
jgi:hypothetical protein